jgi:hypothetical protein
MMGGWLCGKSRVASAFWRHLNSHQSHRPCQVWRSTSHALRHILCLGTLRATAETVPGGKCLHSFRPSLKGTADAVLCISHCLLDSFPPTCNSFKGLRQTLSACMHHLIQWKLT